jgi:GxxExxY protein
MEENEITRQIIDICYHIHKELGPGLFESVYEEVLYFELTNQGFIVERQKAVPVIWKGRKMDIGFRADLIVNNQVIIELKSVERVPSVYKKQLLTYLRITGIKVGLLINFNETLFKDGIYRIVNNL